MFIHGTQTHISPVEVLATCGCQRKRVEFDYGFPRDVNTGLQGRSPGFGPGFCGLATTPTYLLQITVHYMSYAVLRRVNEDNLVKAQPSLQLQPGQRSNQL